MAASDRINQIIMVALVGAVVAGVVWFMFDRQSDPQALQIDLEATDEGPIEVYITGAVENPDVYVVEDGDRLSVLLDKAGGTTADADTEAVNLAARLHDEDHWHIPRLGEAPTAVTVTGSSSPGKIDLNSASLEELKTLQGIGDTRASSIIRYRELNGPFSTVDDLEAINGIGGGTINTIRDLVEAR